MTKDVRQSPAARLSRLFRKAGVFIAKEQWAEAIAVLHEGEALARTLGNAEKLGLFLEEIEDCEKKGMKA